VAAVRLATEVLREGQWEGQRAFVVGGGPSLKSFPFERLQGEHVIAVNRATEAVPWAELGFTMDGRFLTWFGRKMGAFEGDLVYHADTADALADQLLEDIARDVFLLPRLGERALGSVLEHGLGHGANSGYGAAVLAYVLGARPVYLLGFDLNPGPEGEQTWFHNGYPANDAGPYARFRRAFEWLAAKVPEGSILNASPDSSIHGFPKVVAWPPRAGPALPLFVTFWTDDYYQEQTERLAASCRAWGVDLQAFHVDDRGSWVLNCAAKAEVVLTALDEFPDRDLVFVDADAELVRAPTLFLDLEADVAAHLKDGQELLSGTVYFRNCEATRRLVRRWIALGRDQVDAWDQKTLWTALQEAQATGLLFRQLPPEYTFIFDTMARAYPDAEPVILHHQASRLVKQREQEGRRRGTARAADGPATPGQGGRAGAAVVSHVQSARPQDRPERTVSLRDGEEVQAVLPGGAGDASPVPGGQVTPRELDGVRIPTPDEARMDPYATHQAALVFAAAVALERFPDLPWAELGCGWYSTPTLAALGGPERLTVHSSDPAWSSKFAGLVRVVDVEDWGGFRMPTPHGLAFLDSEQLVLDRVKLLPRLLSSARLVVMHDWRDGLDEGLLGTASRYVYTRCGKPWTIVASNHLDLDDLARGRLG